MRIPKRGPGKRVYYPHYRFRRMPVSLKMSQEVVQAKMDQTFEGKWLDLLVARMTT